MRTLLALLLLPLLGGPLPARDKPNVVIMLVDDLGSGDVSCLFRQVIRTPNIDRIAKEGVKFTSGYVTAPLCGPSRAGFLTGRYQQRFGFNGNRDGIPTDLPLLPGLLKSAGYRTGIFGKWHLGDEPALWPSRRGFDEMFIHGAGGIGQTYPGSCGDAPGNSYFNPAILHNGRFVRTTGYCTDVFFGRALDWMGEIGRDRPFLAWIATNAPHGPLDARPEDEARYTGKVPDADTAKYFGMIANIDDNVGRLLDRLDTLGIARDTLVVFMNDNGGTVGTRLFNAGMRGSKGSPWLGGTRSSSLWRWPARLRPADVPALTAHLDFFPTLAELAGAPLAPRARAQVEGRSLVPLLADPAAPWPERTLFTHVGRWPLGTSPDEWKYRACSVRDPRWQLVSLEGGRTPKWQLFDLRADPGQQQDVSARHPEVVAALQGRFDDWWAAARPLMVNEGATGPKVNPFKELYWQQFGGGPSEEDLRRMDPVAFAAQQQQAGTRKGAKKTK